MGSCDMLRCSFGVEQMPTGEIEILCCFWGKAKDQKKSESLFMDFCQCGFFHSYGAFMCYNAICIQQLAKLSTEKEAWFVSTVQTESTGRRWDLCPYAFAVLIAVQEWCLEPKICRPNCFAILQRQFTASCTSNDLQSLNHHHTALWSLQVNDRSLASVSVTPQVARNPGMLPHNSTKLLNS